MKNWIFLPLVALLFASCAQSAAVVEQTGYTNKEAIENILERKSVRSFLDTPVEQQKVDLIVRAGMAAPSGMDRRPWEIIVIDDRAILDDMAEKLPYAKMLLESPLAIIVCGDSNESPLWDVDCAAVIQNMLLAAEALDLGAVWTGVYPSEERVLAVSTTFGIPEGVLPLAVIPIGYPKGEHKPKDKYDAQKIHKNGW